jgi:glycosyltransferase involved in cell wall biosynthesis
MRVLAVTNLYPTSEHPESGAFVKAQVGGLEREGHQVRVCFVNRKAEGASVYLKLRRLLGAAFEAGVPDLVHVMYGGVMAERALAAIGNLPVVISFCGSDLLGERLSGILRRCVSQVGVIASRRAARRAGGIVVKSRNLEAALPADVARDKVRIIPNGVDLEVFRPMDRNECRRLLGWPLETFQVLINVSSGDPVKRPGLAKAAVERLAARYQVPAELRELRGVFHREVPVWLNAADAVLLTSAHEGSPNIIKEALTCDRPVVSVEVGDVAERIRGIEGCHLAAPEADALARCLHLVRIGPGRVEGRGRMGELSVERAAQRVGELYEWVLERRGVVPTA